MTLYLGLTGGIATGKSTASEYFRTQGVPVVDTDKIAHELMEPGQASYKAIVNEFGSKILNEDKTINRKKLGEIVFNNPSRLNLLNDLTHPLIRKETFRQMKECQQNGSSLCVVDVPLLFESNWNKYVDKTLVIYTTPELELKHLMERDGLSYREAIKRINSQLPLKEKVKKADYTIENTATIDKLEKQLSELLQTLRKGERNGMS